MGRAARSRAPAKKGASSVNGAAGSLLAFSLSRQRVPKPVRRGGVQVRAYSDAVDGFAECCVCRLHRAVTFVTRASSQRRAHAWDRLVVASFNAGHAAVSDRRGFGGGYVRGPGTTDPFQLRA